MTSQRSNRGAVCKAMLPFAVFIPLAIAFADHPGELIFGVGILTFFGFVEYRRRSTLRQRDDGTYVWIEWHGGERCATRDPSEPGGEWDSDADGDGGD